MATLKETFSLQVQELQADLEKRVQQNEALVVENEEVNRKGE